MQLKIKKCNNRGLSLVEVLLYIVIGMIVIGYALNAMTAVAKGYVRERSVTGMQASGRDAIGVLGREIATTGFKVYLDTNTITPTGSTQPQMVYTTQVQSGAYLEDFVFPQNIVNAGAYPYPQGTDEYKASIIFGAGPGLTDTLEIFRAKMRDAHNVSAVERIKYYVDNTGASPQLIRELRTLKMNEANFYNNFNQWNDPVRMVLADNVVALQFQFSENSMDFVDDFTGSLAGNRHLVKYIKIQMLVRSNRTQKVTASGQVQEMGDLGNIYLQTGIDPNQFLYRFYEKTVEVPSNGAGVVL